VAEEPDLIARARSGDPLAWRDLYTSLTGRLLVWLRARPTGDSAADAEDIAMATWLVAAERIADFTGDESDFAGWLFGIARNHVLNARRRTHRRATDPTAVDDSTLWGTCETDDRGDDEWVRQVLASLPPREAEVLACIDVVGLDVASTARMLGMGTNAVRVARHRGLTRLRRSHVGAADRDRVATT
jgi:RNA polymerase sigma-70 factor (ECF subfamily)